MSELGAECEMSEIEPKGRHYEIIASVYLPQIFILARALAHRQRKSIIHRKK
jgi:hypothetical protein